jgi:hypothetical protein
LIQRGTKRKVSAILTDYNQGVFDNYEDLQENGLDHDQSFANGEYNFLDADYYDNGLPDTDEPADQYQHHGGSAGNEFGQHSRMKTSDDDFRYIGMFQTSTWYEHTDSHPELRAISKLNTIEMHVGHLELDSHADTYTAGKNTRILSHSNKVCQVPPYHPQYQAIIDIPIMQVGVAYNHPETGVT